MTVPIVVFLYKRPLLVQTLIKELATMRPQTIWLIADGPKCKSEEDNVNQSRQLAEKSIVWPCSLNLIYSNYNMGLKQRIESGLDAVFSREDKAIILEEDCRPSMRFFSFCEEMLERYRDEPKVAGVSGNCFLPLGSKMKYSYFFSRYLHIWGWATWARVWNSYDRNNWSWPKGGFREIFPEADRSEVKYWNRIFQRVSAGEIDTWDYSLLADLWRRGMVAITPSENLVDNVGFGSEATNTRDLSIRTGIERKAELNLPFHGPALIEADFRSDQAVFRNVFLRMEGRRNMFEKIRDRCIRAAGLLR